MASHSGTASPIFRDNWVVGVNVYGSRPSRFIVSRNSISDVSITAHLCPPTFSGRRSCCVNRPTNQLCRVRIRLFSHRDVGVG